MTSFQARVRSFSAAEFVRIMHCESLVGALAFWRALQRLAKPDGLVCFHARGILTEWARRSLEECRGLALSPQHGEALRYCGLEPVRVAAPGELGSEPIE
jgi:hypothetical protein